MDNIENDEARVYKKRSQFRSIWKRLLKNRTAVIGLIVFSILIFAAIFADVIADYDTRAIAQNASQRLEPPSGSHWFGTDQYGRDIFARIIHGARASLSIGLVTVAVGMVIGNIVGSVAGYFGGWLDNIIMRILDVIMSLPPILMALAIVAVLGPGMLNMMIALAIALFPSFARVVRSVVMPITSQDFIEAAKACGTGHLRIIFRHVIPNAIGPIIVQGTMAVSRVIIVAASLSFLGLGIQPPTPEWGGMLSSARDYMATYPHLIIIPGLTIVIAALSINLFGDGLRDALDPRMKS
jgi:peptide/nickel transport system permease protein